MAEVLREPGALVFDPDLPHTRNLAVSRIGDVLVIYFQGQLASTDARPVVELLVAESPGV